MLEHWPQELQIGFPNLDGILFSAFGPIQGHKARQLLVTWGRLKRFFSISALTLSVKPLGADFNFCTNKECLI
jgi:hypothetical protein